MRLSPGGAAAVVGAVVLAVVLQRAFVAAHRTIGWAVACSVVALLLDPVIQFLDRRLPRWLAVVASLLAVVALAVAVSYLLVRQLSSSVTVLRDSAPEAARRLEARFQLARDMEVGNRVSLFVNDINARLRKATLQRVGTAPTYLVNGILTLFLLAYGRRYVKGGLAQIAEDDQR
jgi:predicted PurR-regulated permease PerM